MKTFLYGFLLVLLIACSQPAKQSTADRLPTANTTNVATQQTSIQSLENGFQVAGDSVVLPAFTIQLTLSPQSEEKLKQLNESIIVSADFEGKPKDTMGTFFQQWGYVVVGNNQIELKEGRTAIFNSVKIPKGAYDSLASKDVDVLINVFSGRHASQNNLLDCESLQEPISKVRQQTIVLHGKLIGE